MKKETGNDQEIDLDIPNGTKLNIKIEGIAIPISSFFVGMEKGEYLLINQPSPFATIKPKLFPGNQLVIQFLSKGTVYVFVCKIIEVLSKPIHVVVLKYPTKLVNRGLRAKDRADCSIPASLIFKGAPKESVIRDVNTDGCRLSITYKPTEKNYIARLKDTIKISSRFPGAHRDVLVSGIIRNLKKKGLSVSYGVQFNEVPADVESIIKTYVATIKD